jgi:hypothetical protein
MKRLIIALSLGSLIWAGGAALASAGTGPEIDKANATIKVSATKVAAIQCPGLNAPGVAAPYETWTFGWKGAEANTAPVSTNYNLTGTFTVPKVTWTVDLATGRGVLTGTATLESVPVTGGNVTETYTGPLTLITQGIPGDNPAGNGIVPARGWMNATTFTKTVKDGGNLLANLEFEINPAFGATGQFGDSNASLGIPDYSVWTNHQAC